MARWIAGWLVAGALAPALAAQEDKAASAAKALGAEVEQESAPAAKRAIEPKDYGQWERLGRTQFSPDGRWLSTEVSRVDETRELRLRMLATDSTEAIEQGARAQFSADSAWLGYSVLPTPDEREKAEKSKKPHPPKVVLRSLTDGESSEFEGVQSFTFRDDGAFVLLRRKNDLMVRDLASGVTTTFGNVAEAQWSDDGERLAMTLTTEDDLGNGLQVFDTESSILRTLDSHAATYRGLTWREDSTDLAVMRTMPHEDDEDASHVVMAWRDAPFGEEHVAYDHREDEGFPEGHRVTEFDGLRWDDDGEVLFFGVRPWDDEPAWSRGEDEGEEADADADGDADADEAEGSEGEEPEEEGSDAPDGSLLATMDERSDVQVWHAKDIDIQPLQERRSFMEERRTHLAAFHMESETFVQLGSDLVEEVSLHAGGRLVVGSDNTPYERQRMFGPTLYDQYLIDRDTGDATKFLEANKFLLGADPDGRFIAYVKGAQLWLYDVESGAHRDVTSGVPSLFINQEMSQLTDEKPPYGIAGWSDDAIFLYDRYDLWSVDLSGEGAERLTKGAEQSMRYRRIVLDDPDEPAWIDVGEDIMFSVYGDRTKEFGYAVRTGGKMRELVRRHDRVSGLVKADEADVYAWTQQNFDDPADVFVAKHGLGEPKQVTEMNPFHDDYLWGRSELVDFESDHGDALQGALFYPAGYEEGKQYPMIVYIYELRSQVLHDYTVPTERHPYNPSVFTAQGYFVFQPDIVYRPQNPGLSAKECVEPAVKSVLERGDVDPERVGLIGHSWGGYQTAFLATVSDVFAACVAGAPLTNMMSMSMSIYWNSGQTDAWIFHESQGRMDQPFWRDVDTYMKNSAIFNLDTMTTPLLMAFGDEDGAVDWHQGIEFYNAARLAEKDFVLLVYPGENHSNAKKENQVDYHHRVLHWFDHYLKGGEARPWITNGISYLERKKTLEDAGGKDKDKGER